MYFEHLEPRRLLSLTLVATTGDDTIETGPGWARINGIEYQDDTITIDALGGRDVVTMLDSAGDDAFEAAPGEATLAGITVANVEVILAYSKAGGDDVAILHDSSGDDVLRVQDSVAKLYGDAFYLRAKFFETVESVASDGVDIAILVDSPGDDIAHLEPGEVTMYGPLLGTLRATAFDYVHCYAREGGLDVAHFEGDRFAFGLNYTRAFGDGFVNRAKFFEQTSPEASEGSGVAETVVGETITMTGTHVLRHSISLRSGDTLTGDATLTRPERVQVDLTQSANTGDTVLYVASTRSFQIGDELGLFAYGQAGRWVTVTDVGINWVSIDTPLDQGFDAGSAVTNYFPLVRGVGEFITIEGLTLDGNHDLTSSQWQVSGGGLIELEADYSTVRNCTVVNAFSAGIIFHNGTGNRIEDTVVTRSRGHGVTLDHEFGTVVTGCDLSWNGYLSTKLVGDGLIADGGGYHEITNNITSNNRRYGMHPAGDLTCGGTWSHNTIESNGANGFHFCWNNFDLTVSYNTIRNNGRNGIGGLGLGGEYGDRFNEIHHNVITGNYWYGIQQNGGQDNRIYDNEISGNRLD